jgi:hypothetical protein
MSVLWMLVFILHLITFQDLRKSIGSAITSRQVNMTAND